jgi:hypothetical protein
MKVGDRVRLMGPMVNPGSKWMPKEKGMEAGLEGEIVYIHLHGPQEYHQIAVTWDNGSHLNLLPGDPYMVLPNKEGEE